MGTVIEKELSLLSACQHRLSLAHASY